LNFSVPSTFLKYTEIKTRVLPKNWSFVETKPFFLGKQLSPYWSTNSPKHKEYLKSILCESANCAVWLGQIYENKTHLNIHAFQLNGDDLRVIHHVPILVSNFNSYSSDILNYKLVSQFNYNNSTRTYNKIAFVITGYIHDKPLTTIDMNNMRNIVTNTRHWGG